MTTVRKGPDSLWLGDATSISIPMTVRSGRPYIDAILDGHSATVLIDTAAVTSLIDTDLVAPSSQPTMLSLQIDQLRFTHLAPQSASVRSYTETTLGVPADLILGMDLLSRYPVQFDFPNKTLTIYRDSQSATAAMPKTAIAAPMRVLEGRPAVEATLDGDGGLWFSLATGAGGDVSLEPNADHAAHLGRQSSLPYEETTMTGTLYGRLVRANSFTLGGVAFAQPLVDIVNAQRPGSVLSGALGASTISRLDLLIDVPGSTLAFQAGQGMTSARLYDPSGMQLALRRGAIVVSGVVPGSPAADRLRPGDAIVSINGLVPASLEFARSLLDGSPETKVQVVYRRYGITRSATLVLKVLI